MMNDVMHGLQDYPLPEEPMEPILDRFLSNAEGLYGAALSEEELDGGSTPVPTGEGLTLSQPWSDRTLTGSASGRCSTLSWVADEAEMDRVAAEKVRRIFSKVNAALYREKSTGTLHVDRECHEWGSTFPHFEVQGDHLLDTLEDGTEMASPILSPSRDSMDTALPDNGLQIIGSAITLAERKGGKGCVHEEVIASEGIIEEYFAFDSTADDSAEQRRRARLKPPHPPHPHHHHAFPPVTPDACVRDTVCNQVFDQIWTEVTSVLHPLIASIQEVSTPGRSSSYSLQVSISEHSTPQLAEQERGGENPLSLASQRGLPPINKPGLVPVGSQMLRLKYSNPTLPQVSLNSDVVTDLQGLMHIKSLPLQQRLSQTYMPSLPMTEPPWEEPTTLMNRPESSLVPSRANTLIPPRTSDYQLPSTPAATNPSANRLLSGRMAGRRLKPLEKPKTPAATQLVPIDDGIVRGHKLRAGVSQVSPPATPCVKNNQLPPLEGSNSLMENAKSPPTIRSGTQRSKGHVSFSTRVVSAADNQEPWRLPRPSGLDLRPNTTANSFRHDLTSKPVGRKVSDYSLHLGVVGYAAGIHGGDSFLRDKISATIAEDEEVGDDDFTVTGTSGYFQSKPRSGRTKLPRGPIR